MESLTDFTGGLPRFANFVGFARNDEKPPSLRGVGVAHDEAISILGIFNNHREIASSFASQKTRNDDSKAAAVIASHAKRGVAIHL